MSEIPKKDVVLIVDDSASMRDMVGVTLKVAGFDFETKTDGSEALEYARENQVMAVLTDVNMPNMDGITLVRELRELPHYRFTPILVLTTESSEESKSRGKDAGATGWIVKPFDPDNLIKVIKRVI
ncbi:MAG: response regulator [Pseudomonadales bacterium]|nr:response regulator [Pseudomonadales bacterium]